MTGSTLHGGIRLPARALVAALCVGANALAAPLPQVQTAAVLQNVVERRASALGTLQFDPAAVSSVTLPRAGVISRLAVRVGQRVAVGDTLFEIDTAPATRMDYLQAQAAVEFARAEVARVTRLLAQQLATRDQLRTAEKALANAAATLASLAEIGADLKTQDIRSPFAGIVTQLGISQGMWVQANTAALLLAHQERLIVQLGVEPEDARQISPGQAVVIAPVFDPEVQFSSVVGAVHGLINPTTRLVDVVVPVPAAQAASVTPGSMVRAGITLASAPALTVPRRAVQFGGDGAYLFCVRDGRAARVPVEIEASGGDQVEVRGALQAGDQVVTVGSHEIEDGMSVRIAAP